MKNMIISGVITASIGFGVIAPSGAMEQDYNKQYGQENSLYYQPQNANSSQLTQNLPTISIQPNQYMNYGAYGYSQMDNKYTTYYQGIDVGVIDSQTGLFSSPIVFLPDQRIRESDNKTMLLDFAEKPIELQKCSNCYHIATQFIQGVSYGLEVYMGNRKIGQISEYNGIFYPLDYQFPSQETGRNILCSFQKEIFSLELQNGNYWRVISHAKLAGIWSLYKAYCDKLGKKEIAIRRNHQNNQGLELDGYWDGAWGSCQDDIDSLEKLRKNKPYPFSLEALDIELSLEDIIKIYKLHGVIQLRNIDKNSTKILLGCGNYPLDSFFREKKHFHKGT
ncbi:MAG: hypothetical protein ACOH2V_13505 [Candidatus Saccharimonadaceae bacterium]